VPLGYNIRGAKKRTEGQASTAMRD